MHNIKEGFKAYLKAVSDINGDLAVNLPTEFGPVFAVHQMSYASSEYSLTNCG